RNTDPVETNPQAAWAGIIAKGGHINTTGAVAPLEYNPSTTKKFPTVNATQVSDGTSNTIAIAEKAVSSRQYTAKVWDWWELPGWAHGADWPNMRLPGQWLPIMPDNQYPRISWTDTGNGAGWFWEPGFGPAHRGV